MLQCHGVKCVCSEGHSEWLKAAWRLWAWLLPANSGWLEDALSSRGTHCSAAAAAPSPPAGHKRICRPFHNKSTVRVGGGGLTAEPQQDVVMSLHEQAARRLHAVPLLLQVHQPPTGVHQVHAVWGIRGRGLSSGLQNHHIVPQSSRPWLPPTSTPPRCFR